MVEIDINKGPIPRHFRERLIKASRIGDAKERSIVIDNLMVEIREYQIEQLKRKVK